MTAVGDQSRPDAPGGSREKQREATAQRILETALGLFERVGFEQTTVDRIVGEAGVAKGTFFHHFASKDAILGWVGEQQIKGLRRAIDQHPRWARLGFEARIRFVLLRLGEAHAQRKGLIKFLAAALLKTDLLTGPHAAPIARLEDVVRPLVEEGQAKGEVRRDVPVEVMVAHIRATYFESILFWLTHEERSYAEVAKPFLELVIRGTESK